MSGEIEVDQELYGAAAPRHCRWLEKQFQERGRDLRLTEVRKMNNPGAQLQYCCVFEGRDALFGAKPNEKMRDRLWRKS